MPGNRVELPQGDPACIPCFQRMGAAVSVEDLLHVAHAEKLEHGQILFTVPSVGSRINKDCLRLPEC